MLNLAAIINVCVCVFAAARVFMRVRDIYFECVPRSFHRIGINADGYSLCTNGHIARYML